MAGQGKFSTEAFVWAVGALAEIRRIPFDARLLVQRFPPPYDIPLIRQALEDLGLRNGLREIDPAFLKADALPCLTFLHSPEQETGNPTESVVTDGLQQTSAAPDAEQQTDAEPRLIPALLLKAEGDKLLILQAGEAAPQTIGSADLAARSAGPLLFCAPADEEPADPAAPTKQPFGFRWFIPELLKHRKIWSEVLLASLFIQIIALATPLFTQVIIDKVVVHHSLSTLIVIAVALGVSLIFNSALSWVRQYLVLHTGNRMDAVLGHRVFFHLLHLPMRYFEHRPTGTMVARLHGVETIREFLAGGLVTLLLDFPFLIIFLALMFWYSWQLTLISVVSLLLITIISIVVTPMIRARLNRQFLLGARNQAFVTEYVSGMETVKSLQLEPQLERRYGDYLASYLAAGFDSRKLSNTYNTVANSIDQAQTIAILCVGAWLVMHNGSLTIGQLIAFQMFSSRLSQPVLRLVGLYLEFQQANISVQRLGDILDAPVEPYTLIPARSGGGQGEIQVQGLSFRYGEDRPWLYRELDFNLPAGRCVVIMGPSGCGKSTFAKLLLGFYQPQEGSILLDGRDIRHLSANELRANFGVVPQETVLFSGTIYENLSMANPHANFENIVHVCKLAEIHDAIEALPQGYQTEIGEHGSGLSGGQKQRIAIARALLRQPRILIFDESVSHLDPHTAEQFAKTVNRLKGKVGMLFITHQMPKGLQADGVIHLGGGHLAPVSAHKDDVAS